MLSFKQYLEEATEYDALQLNLFVDESTVTPEEINEVRALPEVTNLTVRTTYLVVEFQLHENFDDNIVDKLMSLIKTKAPNANFLSNGLYGRIFCNRLPLKYTINLTSNKVTVAIRATPNLKDINKSIIAAEYIELFNEEDVESHVLGLFKVKGLKKVVRYAAIGDSQVKWLQIVNKHLEDNRNIIACQEELFKNGMKEYAKL